MRERKQSLSCTYTRAHVLNHIDLYVLVELLWNKKQVLNTFGTMLIAMYFIPESLTLHIAPQ